MADIKLYAPAKINLALDVTGKRSDGYHTLLTIMQSISLADTVEISLNNNGIITVDTSDSVIPTGEKNIAYKAAQRFIEYTNIQHNGINIHIHKNIPSEAGLGGGSADAAAVLVGLNQLFKCNLTSDELCNIGVKTGADVPFCIRGGTQLCSGIGEIMENVHQLENCCIVIAKGKAGISTATAFEKIDSLGPYQHFPHKLYDGTISSVSRIGRNIFEKVTENSDVQYIKQVITGSDSEYSAMSGSGSAVFGLFYEKRSAEKAIDSLTEKGYFAYLCKPIHHGASVI